MTLNNILVKQYLLITIFSVMSAIAMAQTGAGSTTTYNSSLTISSGTTVEAYAETVYIGPNAILDISGDLIIYSKYVWIAPTAQIGGSGAITFANPDNNPFYPDMTGATTIDANNGNPINTILRHENPNNIILGDISDPVYGTVNPPAPMAAALKLGSLFLFNVAGGDILLNGNDLILTGDGILGNYYFDRFVVTGNSINGHVVQINNGTTHFTVFPVGIAENDFTPVFIQGSADYHVSVTNYTASGAVITRPQEGMDRTWHVYGGAADQVMLLHNIATNGTAYTDADAFITRYLGSGNWSSSLTPDYIEDGFHYNTGTIASGIPVAATADGAWLTKTSDALTPLPVKLLHFNAYKKDNKALLDWATASEQNNKGFDIERSIDGRNWVKIGFVASSQANGNSNTRADYSFNDNNPVNGQNYYRLKQTDIDGKHAFSDVRSLWFSRDGSIVVFPNPAKAYVQVAGLEGNESIYVYDATGRLVLQQKSNGSLNTLLLHNLSEGVYYIRIVTVNGNSSTHQFIKTK